MIMTRYYVMELKEVQKEHFNVSIPMSLSGGGHMLLLSRFSPVRLCATP